MRESSFFSPPLLFAQSKPESKNELELEFELELELETKSRTLNLNFLGLQLFSLTTFEFITDLNFSS